MLGAELLGAHGRVVIIFFFHVVQRVDQRVVLVLPKVLLDDFHRLLVDLVVLVRLQVLQIVQAVLRLHHYRELVVARLVLEVLLAALQNVVDALQSNGEHFHRFIYNIL